MNGKDYSIKLNSFEMGVLTGVMMQLDDRNRQLLIIRAPYPFEVGGN